MLVASVLAGVGATPVAASHEPTNVQLSRTSVPQGESVTLTITRLTSHYNRGEVAANHTLRISLCRGNAGCAPFEYPPVRTDLGGNLTVSLTIPGSTTPSDAITDPISSPLYHFLIFNGTEGTASRTTSPQFRVTSAQQPPPPPEPNRDPGPALQYDLVVTKSGPLTATTEASINYVVNVSNRGPAAAPSVILVDVLQSNGVEVGGAFGPVLIGPAGHGTCGLAAGRMVCDLRSLAPGKEVSVVFSVRPPAGGFLVNTASVDRASDPNPGDNSASVVTTVQDPQTATADLSVTKNFDTSITTGPTFGYEWLVRNLSLIHI